MPKRYAHHKYTWSRPFGSARHQWEFVGPLGGVQFTASFYDNTGKASCGLEYHFNRLSAPADTAPHHIKCWLTGEPCWHDGTTLYAEETLWPRIEPLLRVCQHETIFHILEADADRLFQQHERAT